MFRRDDNRHFVECPIVDSYLFVEPTQRVALAFDLKPNQGAVYQRKVNPRLTLAESQFINQKCARITLKNGFKRISEFCPYIEVSHARTGPRVRDLFREVHYRARLSRLCPFCGQTRPANKKKGRANALPSNLTTSSLTRAHRGTL